MNTRTFLISGIIALLGVCLSPLQAQQIVGKLVDEKQEPVSFANIILLSLPDSSFIQGTVTDIEGKFTMIEPNETPKVLQITYVGYDKIEKLCTTGDVGMLHLVPSAVMLGEAVVTAKRPMHVLKGSTLTTNIENTLLSSVGTARDVLKRIPGLRVTESSMVVFGKGVPLIYINGRQVRDLSELEQLNSAEIAKVELITNPGAQYNSEVKAVLKIRTIKPVGEGIGGLVRSSLQKGEFWGNNQQVQLNYRKSGLDVFGSLYYDKSKMQSEQQDEQIVHGDDLWNITDYSLAPLSKEYLQGQAGANYIINDKHSLGIRYTIQDSHSSSFIPTDYSISKNGADFDRMDFTNTMKGSGETHKANAYYTGLIGKLNIDINFDVLSGTNKNNQDIEEKSANEEDRKVHSLSKAKNRLYAGKLVMSYPVGKGSLLWGTEISFTKRDNIYVNEEHFLDDDFSKIEESNQAGFISYSLPVGKVYFDAGIRYEHVSFKYFQNEIKQDEQCKEYDHVFPSLSVSFPIKDAQFSLSYTAKTSRPSYHSLRSNVQYASRYTYEQGNPLLQPEITHDITLQAGYKFIQFAAFYDYSKNAMISMAHPYPGDNSITVFQPGNISKMQVAGASLALSSKFGLWQPSLTTEFMQQYLTGNYCGAEKHFNRPAVALTWNNQFQLPADIVLSIDGYYANSYHSGYSLQKQVAWMDMGIRKSFFKNTLDINVQATDLFATQRDKRIMFGDIMTYNKWNYQDTRQVRVMVTYRFNASRSKYKGTGAAGEEMRRLQ